MSMVNLSGTTAVVTGASRGFGRATTISLVGRGAHVVGVARNRTSLEELKEQLGDEFTAEVADVTDPSLPGRLFSRYRPHTVVLNAGATPKAGGMKEQTWDSFGANWTVDVRQVFNFTREALTTPLDAGSVVISLSSGAALRGSPMSGGYAGAKSTIRFISSYAGSEAQRDGLRIRFVAALPQLTPATELGRIYSETYAAQAGLGVDQFLEQSVGGVLTAEGAGRAIAELAADESHTAGAYLVTRTGLRPIE